MGSNPMWLCHYMKVSVDIEKTGRRHVKTGLMLPSAKEQQRGWQTPGRGGRAWNRPSLSFSRTLPYGLLDLALPASRSTRENISDV